MDRNTDEYEKLSKDPDKLLEYLADRIETMNRVLDDDESFCNKDIETSKRYIKTIEEKFLQQTQKLKDKLEQLRLENEQVSKENKEQYTREIENINELFSTNKYEAWKKFKDYEKTFQQRKKIIQHIPKLNMNEMDIEQYFSSNPKSTKPSAIQTTNIVQSTITTTDDIDDSTDDIPMTNKERRRKEKIIETTHINKDDEEVPDEKPEKLVDNSLFGIRSKQKPIQSTMTNETSTNNNQTSATPIPPHPTYRLSTRLGSSSSNSNRAFSGRNISTTQNNNSNSRTNHEQRSPIPNSTHATSQQYTIQLTLNPVLDYQYERNSLLLTACNPKFIVLFTSRRDQLNKSKLGAIERGSHIQHPIDWHDGLIISMGSISNNDIYMFTEGEFFIYSLIQRRKLNSRMLKHGNVDGYEVNNSSSYEYQRGIGTVHDNMYYHIYLNRNSRWALSRTDLNTFTGTNDIDLDRISSNLLRFIHLCVSEKTMNYLVKTDDSSYAVIFSSKIDHTFLSSIILPNAQQPLTICSAFIKSLKCEVFFINDPSIDILHILTIDRYLKSYSIVAHAICYVPEKHELMIVTNNSICSINLNDQNLFS